MAVYLLAMQLPKMEYVGTAAVFFTLAAIASNTGFTYTMSDDGATLSASCAAD